MIIARGVDFANAKSVGIESNLKGVGLMKTNYDKLSEDCIEVSKLQWKFSSLLRIVK